MLDFSFLGYSKLNLEKNLFLKINSAKMCDCVINFYHPFRKQYINRASVFSTVILRVIMIITHSIGNIIFSCIIVLEYFKYFNILSNKFRNLSNDSFPFLTS